MEGKVTLEVEVPPAPPPGPPEKAVVKGGQIQTLDRVYFQSKGESVKPESFPVLDAVAALLIKNTQLPHIRVEAHTDNVVSNNQVLSQKRAEWVRTYLIKKGVAADRLIAKGFGASRPIAPNETPDGRQLNRRVEFVITE